MYLRFLAYFTWKKISRTISFQMKYMPAWKIRLMCQSCAILFKNIYLRGIFEIFEVKPWQHLPYPALTVLLWMCLLNSGNLTSFRTRRCWAMPFPNFGDGASSTFVSGCTMINAEMEDVRGRWLDSGVADFPGVLKNLSFDLFSLRLRKYCERFLKKVCLEE